MRFRLIPLIALVLCASTFAGQVPNYGGGGSGGTSLPVADTTAVVKGSADATKTVLIEADGLTTGTARTMTMPDADTKLPVFSYLATFIGPTQARTYTLPDANKTLLATDGSGASLTALNATQLTSGTVPDAAFPATLPAASGANLTALSAGNVSTGTLASARGGTGVSNAGTITNASNTTITGGGTLALGGFTATIPATDTVAELGQANAFTGANTFSGSTKATQVDRMSPPTPTASTSVLTSNVVTIATTAAHGIVANNIVVIASSSHNSAFNGTYLVTSVPSTTTFTYSKTNANIGSAADTATITVQTPIWMGDPTLLNATSITAIGALKNTVVIVDDGTNGQGGLVLAQGASSGGGGTPFKFITNNGSTSFSMTGGGAASCAGTFTPTGGLVLPNIATELIYAGSYANFIMTNPAIRWPSNSPDIGVNRHATGVLKISDGSTGIKMLLGKGADVASATAMPLPTGNVFHVTGTTDITSITSTNFQAGCQITLIFDGVLNFTDGSNLKLAGTFATTADDTITLVYDGTNWYETARSVN